MVRFAATDSTGSLATTYITCAASASAQIIGVDNTSQQQSSLTNVTITAPLTNAGNITACGTSSAQYINYTLDGTNYSLTSAANDSLTAYSASQGSTNTITYIMGDRVGSDNINFNAPAGATGIFPVQRLTVQGHYNTTLVTPFNVTFTKFAAAVGDFYEGSFSGNFTDSSINHTINTTFRIRRSF